MKEKKSTQFKKYLDFSAIGLEMGLSVILAVFAGIWLDRYFQTKPFLLILFILFGFAAATRSLIRAIKLLKKHENQS